MAESTAGIPPTAVARFVAAEAKLYPMVAVDPAGYERATVLVGQLLHELRHGCPDIASVLRRRDELVARLPALAADARVKVAGLPADAVVDAASAVRCRELQAAGQAGALRARIEAAQSAGQEWLIDEPDPAAVMAGSYRRVERHLRSGMLLISSIQAGSAGAASTYTVELIPALPSTTPQHWTYPNREAWLAAASQFRAELSRGSP